MLWGCLNMSRSEWGDVRATDFSVFDSASADDADDLMRLGQQSLELLFWHVWTNSLGSPTTPDWFKHFRFKHRLNFKPTLGPTLPGNHMNPIVDAWMRLLGGHIAWFRIITCPFSDGFRFKEWPAVFVLKGKAPSDLSHFTKAPEGEEARQTLILQKFQTLLWSAHAEPWWRRNWVP